MDRKAVSGIMLTIVMFGMLTLASNIQQVRASEAPPMEWSKTYGGADADYAYSLVHTSDGGYVLAGSTSSYGAGGDDFWLVKTDSAGNHQWNRTYGGMYVDFARSAIQTSDGGYALTGNTGSYGAGSYDFWLIKTEASGTMQWSKTYGGASDDAAHSVVQTGDGGYALAGETYGVGYSYDFWLVKTDSSGNMQWNRTYGGAGADYAHFVVQSSDGGYAIAGTTQSYDSTGDFWLVKTDSAGNAQWNRTYGIESAENCRSMIQTNDGGYALAGYTYSYGAGYDDFWLVKTDSAGNMQWNRTYGGTSEDSAYSVVQTGGGGYAMAGRTKSFGAGIVDFWLVKLGTPAHELVVSITAPALITLGSSSSLNATVTNQGSGDEASVEFSLIINGSTVNSTTVSVLKTGNSYTLSHLWTPTVQAIYNVTAYACPVPSETSTENNQKTKLVTAARVGVKAGDWIKCDYTITGAPAGTPLPQWLKVEFLSVEGTNATVRVTMHMSDGTEQNATVPVDVVAGGQALGLLGFVIPANLTTGHTIFMSGYGNVTIAGETTRTYAGASRTVVYASFSQLGTQLTYYWDKQTGVMVEASTTSGSITVAGKATETNMWQADSSPFWMQWWFYVAVAVVIVALGGAVYFLKKRKPQTPTAPPLPTKST